VPHVELAIGVDVAGTYMDSIGPTSVPLPAVMTIWSCEATSIPEPRAEVRWAVSPEFASKALL